MDENDRPKSEADLPSEIREQLRAMRESAPPGMRHNGRYRLVGQTPVPCEDLIEWATPYETGRDYQVGLSKVGSYEVSTIFLAVDHSFQRFNGEPHTPILFETAVFELDEENEFGRTLKNITRCATWLEAEEQHKRICGHLAREFNAPIEEIPWREPLPEVK